MTVSNIFYDWYHSIEYERGKYTSGKNFDNIIATRTLISRIENLKSADCLDVGTVDTLLAILLERRGAKFVLAADMVNYSERVSWLQSKLGSKIEYLFNVGSMSYVDSIKSWYATRRIHEPGYFSMETPEKVGFDLIVCSGYLYHVFSPIHALGQLRTLLRNDGLMIIETALVVEKQNIMLNSFTAGNYVYGKPGDTWFLSPGLLDHYLRFFRLKPIDCAYIRQGPSLIRCAITCRAIDEWIDYGNEDLAGEHRNLESHSLVDFSFCQKSDANLAYNQEVREAKGIDLYETIINQDPEPNHPELIRLSLDAVT